MGSDNVATVLASGPVPGAPTHLLTRVESTRLELVALRQQIVDWLARCRLNDRDANGKYVGRHRTQLEAIESVLFGAADALEQALPAVGETDAESVGALYDACRDHDLAIVWLRRLWRYFADRLDQRAEGSAERALLKAADEVVWSCHRSVLQRAKLRVPGLVVTPAPLPYLSAEYSPAAIESARPLPSELQLATEIPGIDAFLKGLSVPLLRLPPWCLASPWWLVFIGHEVGHQLQHDLGLVRPFAEGLEAVARQVGAGAAAARWKGWADEIFADVVSLLTMGSVALWAMAELEWARRPRMLRPSARYPAPAVRLELMRECARRLGLEPAPAELELRLRDALAAPGLPAQIAEDLIVLPKALDFALGPMDGALGTLIELSGFEAADFAAGSACAGWAATLAQQDAALVVPSDLRSPRLLAAAGATAWWDVRDERDDARRAQRREALRKNLLDTLPRSGPPGVRAPLQPSGARPGKGQKLADAWLAASRTLHAAGGGDDDATARPD